MQTSWESDIAALLAELSSIQDEVLAILGKKRDLLLAADAEGLTEFAPAEEELIDRLRRCVERRGELLRHAKEEGKPSTSLRALSGSLPREKQAPLEKPLHDAAARARLLQHQSLTNWVVMQRTLIHLSQLLEIIATGGRPRPTYGGGEIAHSGGNLVDRAA
ncbi:MAG: flagellar export chaperone FlgN [Planctomycetota bacterium]